MAVSFGTVGLGLVCLAGVTLAIVGSPDERGRRQMEEAKAEAPPGPVIPAKPAVPTLTAMSGGGITLRTVSITLPSSDREYPAGAHADAINNNCLSCHSAGMVMTQPALTRAEWQGEVTKMVKVYKAPVEPADMVLIVDYLTQLKPPR